MSVSYLFLFLSWLCLRLSLSLVCSVCFCVCLGPVWRNRPGIPTASTSPLQISPSSRPHGAPPAAPIPTKVEGRSLAVVLARYLARKAHGRGPWRHRHVQRLRRQLRSVVLVCLPEVEDTDRKLAPSVWSHPQQRSPRCACARLDSSWGMSARRRATAAAAVAL